RPGRLARVAIGTSTQRLLRLNVYLDSAITLPHFCATAAWPFPNVISFALFSHSRNAAYQLAFLTPGINPASANSRKWIRQMPNLRYTARGRPHNLQRRTRRVVNFGFRKAAAIFDLLAMHFP